MKFRWIAAAASFALIAFAAPGSAQARLANSSLAATPLAGESQVQQAQYYRHRRHYRPHYRYRHHYRHRYRHCWNERVRVRTPAGYFVWRTHRRCGWR
jgi:hypothetical protein